MAAAGPEPQPNAAARLLLDKISRLPCAASFKCLPDPIVHSDYYVTIKRPLALSDMARAMTTGRYSLVDMQCDLRRMLANAKRYNKPEAQVYSDALEIEVRGGLGVEWLTGCSGLTCPPPLPQRVLRRLVKEVERAVPEEENEDAL